ncbi:MAG TPA: hypothetical protein VI386_30640, partial [Candidatus Sulfotelmatobacter sp.]
TASTASIESFNGRRKVCGRGGCGKTEALQGTSVGPGCLKKQFLHSFQSQSFSYFGGAGTLFSKPEVEKEETGVGKPSVRLRHIAFFFEDHHPTSIGSRHLAGDDIGDVEVLPIPGSPG